MLHITIEPSDHASQSWRWVLRAAGEPIAYGSNYRSAAGCYNGIPMEYRHLLLPPTRLRHD